MDYTSKGRSVFALRKIRKGEIICNYEGVLCSYNDLKERVKKYSSLCTGNYILEFKYREKRWGIDATEEDGSFGRLINHSRKCQNAKPLLGEKNEIPYIYFVATRDILKDEEILYDYGDRSKTSKESFPWLKL